MVLEQLAENQHCSSLENAIRPTINYLPEKPRLLETTNCMDILCFTGFDFGCSRFLQL